MEMSITELPVEMVAIAKTVGAQDGPTSAALEHPSKRVPGASRQFEGVSDGCGSHRFTDANLLKLNAKTCEELDALAHHARVLADLCGPTRAGAPRTLRTH